MDVLLVLVYYLFYFQIIHCTILLMSHEPFVDGRLLSRVWRTSFTLTLTMNFELLLHPIKIRNEKSATGVEGLKPKIGI